MSLPKTYKLIQAPEAIGQPIKHSEVPIPTLSKNQVLIKMEYASLNPIDVYVMKGFFKYAPQNPHPVGVEGSGVVVAVGPELKINHKIGENVHVYTFGTYGEYAVAESHHCTTIKDGISLEEAASHIANPGTAYILGNLAEGHKAAIVTGASSVVGRMTIRYLKYKGIKVIGVVRKDQYIEELKTDGADYVLNSETADFEEKLKEIAHKENATFAADGVYGDFLGKVLRAMPNKSICYVYGALSGQMTTTLGFGDLSGQKQLSQVKTFDYYAEYEEKGEFHKFLEEMHSLLPTCFKTKIIKVFSLDKVEEAIEFNEANKSEGKVLIKLSK